MIKIEFPFTYYNYGACGKSGYTQTHGIAVSDMGAEFFLESINSRDVIGSARIVCPRTHLMQLRDAIGAMILETASREAEPQEG